MRDLILIKTTVLSSFGGKEDQFNGLGGSVNKLVRGIHTVAITKFAYPSEAKPASRRSKKSALTKRNSWMQSQLDNNKQEKEKLERIKERKLREQLKEEKRLEKNCIVDKFEWVNAKRNEVTKRMTAIANKWLTEYNNFHKKSPKLDELIKAGRHQNMTFPKGAVVTFSSLEYLNFIIGWEYNEINKLKKIRYWYQKADVKEAIIVPYLENRAGIYLITNNINKKKYIGKSANLLNRLNNYLNFQYLRDNPTRISRNIRKYLLHNFSFSILEHCDTSKLSQREQFFIDKFKPQYNIRKIVFKANDPK